MHEIIRWEEFPLFVGLVYTGRKILGLAFGQIVGARSHHHLDDDLTSHGRSVVLSAWHDSRSSLQPCFVRAMLAELSDANAAAKPGFFCLLIGLIWDLSCGHDHGIRQILVHM